MTDITIPPEALEAGVTILKHYHATAEDAARACFTAILRAWPGMQTYSGDKHFNSTPPSSSPSRRKVKHER